MKTKSVLFNIVTRCSRKNYFKICYDSIHNQTYKKFRHIVTYETEEMREYLEQFDDLTLVKVTHRQKIPNLKVCWNYSPSSAKYLNPNYEIFDYKALNRDEDENNFIYKDDYVVIENECISLPMNEENTTGCSKMFTLPQTISVISNHFPYNTYMKIAERAMDEDAWVLYLDDDDRFYNNTVLNNLNSVIVKKGTKNVLHINDYHILTDDKTWPTQANKFLFKHGFPFILGTVGTSNMCFHTKFKDYTYWDEWSSGDYRTIVSLREAIGEINFTNITTISLHPPKIN